MRILCGLIGAQNRGDAGIRPGKDLGPMCQRLRSKEGSQAGTLNGPLCAVMLG
jgi:hypothetical protein